MFDEASSSAPGMRIRPLAACLAAVCGVAAAAPAFADAAKTSPATPATIFVTNCNDSGAGSLRDAIDNAANEDTINLTTLACSTISLTTGALTIGQDSLAFVGPGQGELTIDASNNNNQNAFYHLGGGSLLLQDMTIANGSKYRNDVTTRGGCIHSESNVLLRNVTVENCFNKSASIYGALGGAIWSGGQTYMTHSTVTGSAAFAGGNGYASGGGIYTNGGILALYSLVEGNSAYSFSATPSFGGGIFVRGYSGIFECAVAYNSSTRMGGLALADNGTSIANVFNSTISGNFADLIGGVYSRRPLYLYNSTIANNFARYSEANGVAKGTGLHMGPQLLTVQSSIIANNGSLAATHYDFGGEQGVLLTGSHNLFTSSAWAPPPDTIGGPVNLDTLTDNGGVTPTMALLPGGFGIDEGAMPPAGIFPNDQRGTGFSRLNGGAVDMGAFESDPDRIFTNGFNFQAPLVARPLPIARRSMDDSSSSDSG